MVVEIFEGAIDFSENNNLHHLIKGDLVALDPNVPHYLAAVKDSSVRLTLSKFDSVERVIEIAES